MDDIDWKALLCDEVAAFPERVASAGNAQRVAKEHPDTPSQALADGTAGRTRAASPEPTSRGAPPWLPLPEWSPHDLIPWSWNSRFRAVEATDSGSAVAPARPVTQATAVPQSPCSFGGIESFLWYVSPDIPKTPVSYRRMSQGVSSSPLGVSAFSPTLRACLGQAPDKEWPGWCTEQIDRLAADRSDTVLNAPSAGSPGRRPQPRRPIRGTEHQPLQPRSLMDALYEASGAREKQTLGRRNVASEQLTVRQCIAASVAEQASPSAAAADAPSSPYAAHPDIDIGILMTNPSFLLKHFHPYHPRPHDQHLHGSGPATGEDCHPDSPRTSGRYARSIGFLTAHLLGLFAPQAEGKASYAEHQTCSSLATALKVAPRRIYDVISVLEAIGILEREARGGNYKTPSMRIRLRSLTPSRLLSAATGARAQRAHLERQLEDLANISSELDDDLHNLRCRLRDLLRQLLYRPGSTVTCALETATVVASELDERGHQHATSKKRWFLLRPCDNSGLTGFWASSHPPLSAERHIGTGDSAALQCRLRVPAAAQLIPVPAIEATTPVSVASVRKASYRRDGPLQSLDPNRCLADMRPVKRQRYR